MLSLASKVPEGLSDDLKTRLTSSPKPPKEEQKKDEPDKKEEPEKKKEDDEKSEEDAAAGLGALFG
jgi:large subunit ribosomal protein L10